MPWSVATPGPGDPEEERRGHTSSGPGSSHVWWISFSFLPLKSSEARLRRESIPQDFLANANWTFSLGFSHLPLFYPLLIVFSSSSFWTIVQTR